MATPDASRGSGSGRVPAKILKRLLALAVGLVVAVALLEIGTAWADPYGASAIRDMRTYRSEFMVLDPGSPRLFRHPPDAYLDLRRHEIDTNSDGLRDREFEKPAPEGQRRILILGDSIVFGWGVTGSDTLPKQLERRLAEHGVGPTIEVVNGGHLFHDTLQEAEVLAEVGLSYRPDVVALVYCKNDRALSHLMLQAATRRADEVVEDPALLERIAKARKTSQRLNKIEPYLPAIHSLLVHLRSRKVTLAAPGNLSYVKELGFSLEEAWALGSAAIDGMRAACAERGAELVVFDFEDNPHVEDYCEEQGLRFARIGFESGDGGGALRVSRADPHPNAKGHALLAERMETALREWGLVP